MSLSLQPAMRVFQPLDRQFDLWFSRSHYRVFQLEALLPGAT
jgi:hypothetical protein